MSSFSYRHRWPKEIFTKGKCKVHQFCSIIHLLSACRYAVSFRYLKKQKEETEKQSIKFATMSINYLFTVSFLVITL